MKRHDVRCFARLAVQIARTELPDDGGQFAPTRSRHPSLLACLCLKASLHLDLSRDGGVAGQCADPVGLCGQVADRGRRGTLKVPFVRHEKNSAAPVHLCKIIGIMCGEGVAT